MSDFFGIGNAIKSMIQVYRQSARATGRTTSLVESVKDGDRVYFATMQEARLFDELCKERGVSIESVVISVSEPGEVFQRGTAEGRAIFDHNWLEQFYAQEIEHISKQIENLERQTSGWGEAHRKTRRKALEVAKFNGFMKTFSLKDD